MTWDSHYIPAQLHQGDHGWREVRPPFTDEELFSRPYVREVLARIATWERETTEGQRQLRVTIFQQRRWHWERCQVEPYKAINYKILSCAICHGFVHHGAPVRVRRYLCPKRGKLRRVAHARCAEEMLARIKEADERGEYGVETTAEGA